MDTAADTDRVLELATLALAEHAKALVDLADTLNTLRALLAPQDTNA